MRAPLIEFDRVTVLRDGVTALDRLTLRIEDGERVAVLGPNGAGKSTLVDALTRAVYPALGLGPTALRIYGRDRWDVIVCTYFLHRPLFSAFQAALAPGGWLVVTHATRSNLERHARPGPEYLL